MRFQITSYVVPGPRFSCKMYEVGADPSILSVDFSHELSGRLQLLTTHQAVWFIISVYSVCLSVCMSVKR